MQFAFPALSMLDIHWIGGSPNRKEQDHRCSNVLQENENGNLMNDTGIAILLIIYTGLSGIFCGMNAF